MSDDLFRAHVEPHRVPAVLEPWPEDPVETPDAGPDGTPDASPEASREGDFGDLLASFDVHRRELAGRLKADAERGHVPLAPRRAGAASLAPRQSEAVPATAATEPPPAALPEPTPVPEPDPLPSRRNVVVPPRPRKPWLIVVTAVVAAVGAGTAVATLGHSPATSSPNAAAPSSTPSSAPSAAPTTTPAVVTRAADWIAANVGPEHVIACDVTVCALLRSRGFPNTSLITVQSGAADVEQADTVVVTDLIRRQLGPGLAAMTAGEPLAVFAAGGSDVRITPVALGGPTVYAGRLAADRTARISAGTALLRNPKITVADAARASLSDGLVDSRVCVLLAALGGSRRITVASFTGAGPGAGPDFPLAGVVISAIDGVDAAMDSPQSTALKSVIHAQRPPYAPLSTTPIASGADRGLAVLFSQPGPVGLLNATTP